MQLHPPKVCVGVGVIVDVGVGSGQLYNCKSTQL
jgi:hypothetical protein